MSFPFPLSLNLLKAPWFPLASRAGFDKLSLSGTLSKDLV